jgi:RNA polymerase sigma-70 factor (ECF subfamily)
MIDDEKKQSSEDYQLFIKLYLANERRIYGYVRALIPSWTDVDDIIQETASVMWSKFNQFEKGTNFPAWALKIAHLQVLNYCKIRKKDRLCFNDSVLESIAHKSLSDVQNTDQSNELSLIQMRYEPGGSTKSVSQQTGKNLHVLYRHLNKIHAKLLMCIRRTMAEGELA